MRRDVSDGLRVVSASLCSRERWRNGLGWTTEIARRPEDVEWSWRLSIAESDQAADFSSFPGVDRELVLLTGRGLRLRFHDGETHELEKPYESLRFPGDRPLTGEPMGGPTRQFNLMWRRDRVLGQVSFRQFTEPVELASGAGVEKAIHLVRGNADLVVGATSRTLSPGDTAFTGPDPGTVWIRGSGSLLEVTVRQRPRTELCGRD